MVKASFSCLVLLALTIIANLHRRKSTSHAQQLVLSCAYFDPEGNIMVTPHAHIPTRKVVSHYIGRVSCPPLDGIAFWLRLMAA